MTPTLTPVQSTVLAYVTACPVCANMVALKYDLEHCSRYVGYTVERAVLELVELGVLVKEGNLVMLPEASDVVSDDIGDDDMTCVAGHNIDM